MGERLKKTDDEAAELDPAERRVYELLGDENSYIEDGEVRPTREQLSKSGGSKDDGD